MSRCKVCRKDFTKRSMTHKICDNVECAVAHGETLKAQRISKQAKESRIKTKARLLELKPRSYWLKECQQVVNRYVRLRDFDLGCVSCDKEKSWNGQWHGSHFRSVGASSALRFHLWNIHKACSVCNNWKSGNLSEYEPRLRERIGNDKVDWLRSQSQQVRYSVEYLQRLKRIFKAKCAIMEKRLELRETLMQ